MKKIDPMDKVDSYLNSIRKLIPNMDIHDLLNLKDQTVELLTNVHTAHLSAVNRERYTGDGTIRNT